MQLNARKTGGPASAEDVNGLLLLLEYAAEQAGRLGLRQTADLIGDARCAAGVKLLDSRTPSSARMRSGNRSPGKFVSETPPHCLADFAGGPLVLDFDALEPSGRN